MTDQPLENCARDVLVLIMELLDEKSIVAMMGVNKFFNSFAFEFLDVNGMPVRSTVRSISHLDWSVGLNERENVNSLFQPPIVKAAMCGSLPSIKKLLTHPTPIPTGILHTLHLASTSCSSSIDQQISAMEASCRHLKLEVFQYFLEEKGFPTTYGILSALQRPARTNIIMELLGESSEKDRMKMLELFLKHSALTR